MDSIHKLTLADYSNKCRESGKNIWSAYILVVQAKVLFFVNLIPFSATVYTGRPAAPRKDLKVGRVAVGQGGEC